MIQVPQSAPPKLPHPPHPHTHTYTHTKLIKMRSFSFTGNSALLLWVLRTRTESWHARSPACWLSAAAMGWWKPTAWSMFVVEVWEQRFWVASWIRVKSMILPQKRMYHQFKNLTSLLTVFFKLQGRKS